MKLTDPLTQLDNGANICKYKMAGKIAAKVLDELVKMAKPGTKLYEMCTTGDMMILDGVNKVYGKVKNKGVAFPTCVSVNNVAGFFIPSKDDETSVKNGDLVKIELGVHIDGFPALVGYTVVINEDGQTIDDKRANAVKAVAEASKEILKLMKPGKTNSDVVKVMEKYAKKYNCQLPVTNEECLAPGTVSYQISQYVIDGYNDDYDEFIHRLILSRESENYDFVQVDNEFEEDEVYAIDILMSTGSGKLSRNDDTTVYKRNHERKTGLKLKASRMTLSTFGKERFPISSRNHDNARFKLGLKECVNKGLIEGYSVFHEKKGEYIARTKFTVIVRKKPILVVARSANEQLQKLMNSGSAEASICNINERSE